MKKYRLLKELPFSKIGDIINEEGFYENGQKSDLIKEWIIDNQAIEDLLGVWIEEVEEVEDNNKYRIGDYVVFESYNKITYMIIFKKDIGDKGIVTYNNNYSEKELRKPTQEELRYYFK